MAAGDLQQRNPMDNIQSILNIFKGAPATTTTNTSSETVSNDKAKAYLQQILESNSGLAAVSSGQKAAGMYGSTVNTQLTNDLLARASAQTAALSSTKTATQTTKPQAQLNPLTTLGAAALGQVLTPVAKAAGKASGLNNIGDNIANALFPAKKTPNSIEDMMNGDTTPAEVANFAPNPTAMPTTALPDLQAGQVNVADDSSSGGASAVKGGSDVASMLGAAGASAGIGAALSGGSAAGTAAALTDASYAIGGTGTFAAAAGATDAAATAATAATATEGAGVLDTLATAAAAAWIICTELNKQGRLPYRYYIYGAREFAKYDERGKQGYYIWAIPSVRHLRANPNSNYSKLMEVVFNARAEYLAAKAGCKVARKTVLGAITTHGLYALCWTLSRTIARKSYTKEQILNVRA